MSFMGRTWGYVAVALLFGFIGPLSLIMGPLYLVGVLRRANGEPATDAGIALCVMCVPILLMAALAVFNVWARQRPLIRLGREGIEVVLVPQLLTIDRWPRRVTVQIPWARFHDARVTGFPSGRRLTIVVVLPPEARPVELAVYSQADLVAPVDEIAEAIHTAADRPGELGRFSGDWHETAQPGQG